MSTLSVATIKSQNTLPPAVQNSSGTEIGTFCRAWVNFNGTGTVAISASFNVSSITDGGTGSYTVNFTNAMPDVNYAVTGACSANTNGFGTFNQTQATAPTTTAAIVRTIDNTNFYDSSRVYVAIFR